MNIGTIKFYNFSKGFGFISPDAGDKEIFLPPSTAQASGIKKLLPGLRVSFEIEPDPRGVRAVNLRAIENAMPVPMPEPVAAATRPAQLSLYHAEQSHSFDCVCDALDDQGLSYTLIDYIAVPPSPELLKRWSLELSGSGASLVRRADPLFYALQLDDRFISESEYWLAVSQHPAILNGPFLVVEGRIGVCKTEDDVYRLLGKHDTSTPPRRKGISARLTQMMQGAAVAQARPVVIEVANEVQHLDGEDNKVPAISAGRIDPDQARAMHLHNGEMARLGKDDEIPSVNCASEFVVVPSVKKTVVLPKARARKPVQT